MFGNILIVLWWKCTPQTHKHPYIYFTCWQAYRGPWKCSFALSPITSTYLVHLLFSPSTLGTAIRPCEEGMLCCMLAHRDSLFHFKTRLIRQWGSRPFPLVKKPWFGWAYQHCSFLPLAHLLILFFLFIFLFVSFHHPCRQHWYHIHTAMVAVALYLEYKCVY